MIETIENIKGQPLFSAIETLKEELRVCESEEQDKDQQSRLARIAGLARILDSNIKGSQDALTPSYAIEEGGQHVQNCLSQLGNYRGNRQPGHLQSALRDIESAVKVFPSPFRIRERKLIDEHIDSVIESGLKQREAVAKFITELDQKYEQLTEEFDEADDELKRQKSELERIRAEAGAALSNLNEEFQKRQVERSSAFSEQAQKFNERTTQMLEERAAEATEVTDAKAKEIDDIVKSFSAKLTRTLQESEETREAIRKLAGLAGTEALVGRFHKVGNDQRLAAGVYRFVAYLGFAVTAAYMAYTVYTMQSDQTVGNLLELMLAKSQLALFLLIPSTFLAIELRRLNRSQARLQELELMISAFGPFIDSLPEPDKNKLKQTMAPVFFQAEANKASKETTISDEQVKLFKEIFSIGKA
jgi:predicted HicB family RNase H-like nuclease